MMNRVKNLLSADNVNLNDWEQGFLDSILSQLKRKRPLSAKQVQMIQKIEMVQGIHKISEDSKDSVDSKDS